MATANPAVDSVPTADLLRQLRELRDAVAALRRDAQARHPRLVLRELPEGAFLGQPVRVVATVSDDRGVPLAGVPVTWTATWGTLRAAEGTQWREGSGVTTSTGSDGEAEVILLPPLSAEISTPQQDALEVALLQLDRGVATPRDAAAGLRVLAREYPLDGNAALRGAVDLYLQEFGQRQRESFMARAYASWPTFDATVFAFARDADPADEDPKDTAVLAMAVLPLRLKDWLGPWLQALVGVTREEGRLEEDLRAIRLRTKDPEVLLSQVYSSVQFFLETRKGIAGELAGRRAAEGSLRAFLDEGLPELPRKSRGAVLRGVEVASSTVTSGGAGVFAAVKETRRTLNSTIDRKVAEVPRVDEAALTGRIDGIAGALAGKADHGTVDALSTLVGQEVGSIRETTRKLDELTTRVTTDVTKLGTDFTKLGTDVTKLGTDAANLSTTLTKLDTDVTKLNTNLTKLGTDVTKLGTDVDGRINATRSELSQTNEVVGRLGSTVTTLGTDLNGKLAGKADTATVNQQLTELGNSKANTADVVALQKKLDTSVAKLNDSVARLDTTLTNVVTRIGTGTIRPDEPRDPSLDES